MFYCTVEVSDLRLLINFLSQYEILLITFFLTHTQFQKFCTRTRSMTLSYINREFMSVEMEFAQFCAFWTSIGCFPQHAIRFCEIQFSILICKFCKYFLCLIEFKTAQYWFFGGSIYNLVRHVCRLGCLVRAHILRAVRGTLASGFRIDSTTTLARGGAKWCARELLCLLRRGCLISPTQPFLPSYLLLHRAMLRETGVAVKFISRGAVRSALAKFHL